MKGTGFLEGGGAGARLPALPSPFALLDGGGGGGGDRTLAEFVAEVEEAAVPALLGSGNGGGRLFTELVDC